MQHTHIGHCQHCGRLQASSPRKEGFIAKHGYNVNFGYFSGTCSGSDKAPLEISHSYTDEVIDSCVRASISHAEAAEALRTGESVPYRCRKGQTYHGHGRYETVWVTWSEASEYLRKQQVEREIDEHVRDSKFMQSHATFLTDLKASVFGQPLRRVAPSKTLAVEVGAQFTVTGESHWHYEVIRINVHGGMSGRAIYTEVKRTNDGKVLKMSTMSVRKYLLGNKAYV